MNTADKPRSDSKLKTLPEARQADIAAYAVDHSHPQVVEWLSAQGIDTSASAVSQFLAWYKAIQQLHRNESAVRELLRDFAQNNPQISPERLEQAGTYFFTSMAVERQDPKIWYLAQQTACLKAKLELDLQKYRDQVQARKDAIQNELDAAKDKGGLSTETIERIERELNLF